MRRDCRNGLTLIEVVVVFAMTSFVLVSSTVLLLSMMRSDRELRRGIEHISTYSKLSKTLRTDVHAAAEAEISKNDSEIQVLRIALADGKSIEYSKSIDGIERRVLEGKVTHRDQFRLPEEMTVKWHLEVEPSHTVLIAEFPTASDAASAPKPLPLECVVGLRTSRQTNRSLETER